MKSLRVWFSLLIWAGALAPIVSPAPLCAQSNPPFQNPSLDSNCYFPQIGVPGEIDTIVGGTANAGIGAYIHNLGPQQGGMPGNLLIQGSGVFEQVPTGSSFNLHNLKAKAQHLIIRGEPYYAHLHNSTSVDILDFAGNRSMIYWADDSGNYDTAHTTKLTANIGMISSQGFTHPYITHLSSDTVDDVVVGLFTDDSIYLGYYRGGLNLMAKTIAFEDTSIVIPPPYLYGFYGMQGDFRGTGRDDLLIADYYNNLFIYKNDPPFSLETLVHAMQYDTLWTTPQHLDSTNFYQPFSEWISMRALPKAKGDNADDFVTLIPTVQDTNNGIFIFRGGPDFGSHRITIDSAAYVITPPNLGYQNWPEGLADGGDMTGTGNHVLLTGGGATGSGAYTDLNYYVTGQALDNKIDLFYGNTQSGPWDTLTANADSLEDQALGNPYYGDSTQGTMGVMYGSKNIPVHLNPQFAEVKTKIDEVPQNNGAGITLSPNPANSWSVATIVWPVSEDGQYSIYDMLGRKLEHGPIHLYGGAEQQRIYFSGMPQGVYLYTIEGEHGSASARFVKLGGASGSTGTSQPSVIQQMKDARDGKTDSAGISSSSAPIVR